jgi:hypothetical protein
MIRRAWIVLFVFLPQKERVKGDFGLRIRPNLLIF